MATVVPVAREVRPRPSARGSIASIANSTTVYSTNIGEWVNQHAIRYRQADGISTLTLE